MKTRHTVLFLVSIIALSSASAGCNLFKQSRYKGDGYSIQFPAGWEKVEPRRKKKRGLFREKPTEITYRTPEEDFRGNPAASITVSTKQLTQAVWIEDSFPEIMGQIKYAGYEILQHGNIKIDGKIAMWALYQKDKISPLHLEFYMVDDTNKMYRILYSALPSAFNKYRPAFEETKDSFKFELFSF